MKGHGITTIASSGPLADMPLLFPLTILEATPWLIGWDGRVIFRGKEEGGHLFLLPPYPVCWVLVAQQVVERDSNSSYPETDAHC